MPKKPETLSFKVEEELLPRIESAANLTGLKKAPLLIAVIEAGLRAIEQDKGLVVPVEFEARIELVPKRVPAYRQKKSKKPGATGAYDVIAREDERRASEEESRSRLRKDA